MWRQKFNKFYILFYFPKKSACYNHKRRSVRPKIQEKGEMYVEYR